MSFLYKLKPAATKSWLQLMAGVMWSGVGVMLVRFAWRWLTEVKFSIEMLLLIAGLALATGIYVWGFSKLAKKNIRRIEAIPEQKLDQLSIGSCDDRDGNLSARVFLFSPSAIGNRLFGSWRWFIRVKPALLCTPFQRTTAIAKTNVLIVIPCHISVMLFTFALL